MIPQRIDRSFRAAASAVAAMILLLSWLSAAGSTSYAQDSGGHATRSAGKAIEVRGGDVIHSNAGTRCTVGFNARSGSSLYGLVTGRCAQGATRWYADASLSVLIGTTTSASFPGNDYALVRYTNSSVVFPGEVSRGSAGGVQDITGAANPTVGQSVCHVGRVTGYRCGTVTAVNVTVNYPEGVVSGLFRSNICSEPGDVGGPAFAGSTALGVIVATTGNCAAGGATYYQPVVEWLSVYGLSLY
ncbi:S1 family peptidase [Streptomyces sp. NBC_00887]|uniref:S1 family peptidase n=1 Tax=Streptomyces sp. NBC_00887 TaxID=2975859 RepID=UPI003866699B|nr:S1 family peptidase [Streptomyces sp. NBC_00887]WSY36073.1 S1 family peptidase [Streptomyces sp. NBC_00887]